MKIILLLILLLFSGILPSSAVSVLIPRSDQAALPESIWRETCASIDRGCDTLLALQVAPESGLWKDASGKTFSAPAAALGDSEAPAPELVRALEELHGKASAPWSPEELADAVYVLFGAARCNLPVSEILLNRLEQRSLSRLSPADCVLALIVLDFFQKDTAQKWEALAHRPLPASPSLSDIAAAALARRARAQGRNPGLQNLPPDVLSYTRWIARRLKLGFYGLVEEPDAKHPLNAENALLISLLAGSLPRQLLIREDNDLFPYTWRNHLANRLLSLQKASPDGTSYFWEHPAPADRATTQAILALRLLAQ